MSTSAGLTCLLKKVLPAVLEREAHKTPEKMESLSKCYRHYSYTSSDGGFSWAEGC